MPDNVDLASLSGKAATDNTTYSGEVDAHVQLMRPVHVTGAEGAKTVVEQHLGGRGGTGALSNVAWSASSVTLKAANAERRALIIVNDCDVALFVKLGATASATSYSYKLNPGEAFRETQYTGIVDGIWEAGGTGAARLTEITA